MNDCDHVCTECDRKPCIELRPKMAVPKEPDYEMMVTANLLMAASIDSLKRKDEQLEAENAKLRELVRDMWPHARHRSRMCAECKLPCDESDECLLYEPMRDRMRELKVEVPE